MVSFTTPKSSLVYSTSHLIPVIFKTLPIYTRLKRIRLVSLTSI